MAEHVDDSKVCDVENEPKFTVDYVIDYIRETAVRDFYENTNPSVDLIFEGCILSFQEDVSVSGRTAVHEGYEVKEMADVFFPVGGVRSASHTEFVDDEDLEDYVRRAMESLVLVSVERNSW